MVGRVLEFRLRLNIQRDIFYKKFLSLVEITNVILKIGNVAKGAIFEKLRFSIVNLTMKKFSKLDKLGILG